MFCLKSVPFPAVNPLFTDTVNIHEVNVRVFASTEITVVAINEPLEETNANVDTDDPFFNGYYTLIRTNKISFINISAFIYIFSYY